MITIYRGDNARLTGTVTDQDGTAADMASCSGSTPLSGAAACSYSTANKNAVPSGNGYERKALTRGSWTVVNSIASYAVQSFEATGVWGDVYGYFIATSLDGTGYLLFVEDFSDGPYSITQNGESISVTPKIAAS